MGYQIDTVTDRIRGCGWRKEGGLYLMSGAPMAPCLRLPIPIPERCPTCSGGLKFTRTAWTWISPRALWGPGRCALDAERPRALGCNLCPVGENIPERAGLLWIGGKHYTPTEWTKEAIAQGVSRRITHIPREFEIGRTLVFVAHLKCIDRRECACGHSRFAHHGEKLYCAQAQGQSPPESGGEESPGVQWSPEPRVPCECTGYRATFQAGVFSAFKPDRIEYVVRDGDDHEKLQRLADRGVRLVRINRAEVDRDLPLDTSEEAG